MLTTSYKSLLIHHLKICKLLQCTWARWDANLGQIVPRNGSKLGLLYQKFQLMAGLLYSMGITLKISKGKDSIAEKAQGLVFLMLFFITLLARWYWPRLGVLNEPCRMLNACLRFEKVLIKEHPGRHPSLLDKLMVAFLQLLETTAILIPTIVIAIQLHNPCALPFLGSLSHYCSKGIWTAPPDWVHVFMLTTDFWIWLHFIYDGSFYIIYAFMVGIVCMVDYLEYFEKMALEIQNSGSSRASLEEHLDKVLHTYKCLRLLEKTINHAMKGQLVPAMIGVCPQIQVFSMFVCIKLYSKIPMPGFLIFPLVMFDSSVNNLVIETLAAKVNTNSVKFLSDLNRGLKSFPNKSSHRKEMRACTAAKIQFGQNFVDKGTPLVIENFCFNQTVSLLLLNSRNN
ncbi:hypothetical protein Fcan01_16887 [Folsomia candida]|uniref:Odorant receptor n=1 Tax=Folsomia candida TaxID=158441 RepID=A0A226DSW1_FOLCA|nr:hypothetical protein Fcan01_16887 [Folsomia candida]